MCSLSLLFLCPFLPSVSVYVGISHLDDHFTTHEYGWTESSGSDISNDPFADDTKSEQQSFEGDEIPFARQGPISY